jgi:FkbM family methyltransferase
MNKLLIFVCRTFEWCIRFFRGISVFGILGAIKVLIWSNRRATKKLKSKLLNITLNREFTFFFRRGIDSGVMSHFYEQNYFIDTNGGTSITRIIDAGANIGDETARFHLLYPFSEIISVEAEKRNFEILKRNFSNIETVRLIHGAVWYESGKVNLEGSINSAESFAVTTNKISNIEMEIQAYTIPEIMKIANWNEVDILKIDIEGSEYELFSRNHETWINKVKCLIFEIPDNDRAETTQMIYKAISRRSFNSYICGENLVLISSNLPWKLRKIHGFPIKKDKVK